MKLSLVTLATALVAFATTPAFAQAVRPLAQEHVVVYESPDPARIYCYTPGIVRLDSGRLVATLDLGGPGVQNLAGPKGQRGAKEIVQGKIFTSDDRGRTWIHRADFPLFHATPFVAGKSLYLLGQAGDLKIMFSLDEGATWSPVSKLTDGQFWTGHAHNVCYANGCVYIVMERYTRGRFGWHEIAPVVLRGRLDADLSQAGNWTFASELVFNEIVKEASLDFFGVPFFKAGQVAPQRPMARIGWLETNALRFTDPDHLWHDPRGKTFHLWMRAHTGGTGHACVAKVVEQGDKPGTGAMATMLEQAPSGKKVLYVPCPGGHMKFFVVHDETAKLYWLLSTQATDSMTRPDRLPADRYNLPNNERHRLQLHFSRNMVDWCFAGIVAMGGSQKESRHYASMAVDGDDLVVLSRSGDARAKSAHDGNLITFHRVKNFRSLV
jgi:hypothetical protein